MLEARAGGETVARRPEFEWLARAGLVARGVVYAVIGVLAIKLAVGDHGQDPDQQGALRTVASQSFGELLLIVLAIGLAGYALWRLLRAALGHGPEASDTSVLDRVGGFGSGIAYAALCVTAIKVLAGERTASSGDPEKPTAGVLGWSGGAVLVGVAGCVMLGVAAYQAYEGLSRGFLEKSKTEQMSEAMRAWFTAIGVVGHLARMVVFGLVGYFLLRAAIEYDADEAVGLDGALAKLQDASYGPVLLGVVAAGLFAFGLFSLLDSRYRRV